MKKWYHQTWGIVVLLIFFFPVGLYLMWKHTNWNKNVKIGICVLLLIGVIGAITENKEPNTENPTTAIATEDLATETSAVAEVEETTTDETESSKEDAEVIKALALAIDSQIFEVVTGSEKTTQILQEGAGLVSQGQGNLLELYDLAKQAKDNQGRFHSNLSSLRDKNNREYISACQEYVVNAQIIAENIMKYLDKQELKYLSEANKRIESTMNYSLRVITERMKYLSSQGISDDEISEILSSSAESD